MGMLSSQPKRKWDEEVKQRNDMVQDDDIVDDDYSAMLEDIENEAPQSTFELDEFDWPATQPESLKKLDRSTSQQGYGSRSLSHSSSSSYNNTLVKSSDRVHDKNVHSTHRVASHASSILRPTTSMNDARQSSYSDLSGNNNIQRSSTKDSARSSQSQSASLSKPFTAPRSLQESASQSKPKMSTSNSTSASKLLGNGLNNRHSGSNTQSTARPYHLIDAKTTQQNSMRSGLNSVGSTNYSNSSRSKAVGATPSSNYFTSSKSASEAAASTAVPPTSAPVKKRAMPWDLTNDTSSKSKSVRTQSSSSTFHDLSDIASASSNALDNSKSRSGLLTDSSMDIKQKIMLSPEQQRIHKMVVDEGKSVFFTGSAGTGKSVLLREIISSLKIKHRPAQDAVAVTASTGMAACNIGGTTIHSFAGIGIGAETAEQLVGKVQKNKNARGRWQRVKVLVIDEVSMVDGILFDKLAAIGTALNKSKSRKPTQRPFGGIQLVITGDFLQLPPVTKGLATFAFEAKAWNDCIDHTVNLTQVFRQRDTRFIDMLNEMRFGRLSAESIRQFKALSRPLVYDDGIDPTELYPKRDEVDRSNVRRLAELPGEVVTYHAEDWPIEPVNASLGSSYNGGRPGGFGNSSQKAILNNFMAPEKLSLKIGAQVMLIKNCDTQLVNGTIGRVVDFRYHELQALEGEDAEEDSKAKIEYERKKAKLVAEGKIEQAPMIEWNVMGGQKEYQLLKREEFKVEDVKGQKVASRKQYPIILAWAMSIHKSQGQTLHRVKVDVNKVFEKGQIYVALSRAISLEGLQVIGFHEKKVEAHEKVVNWSKSLEVLR